LAPAPPPRDPVDARPDRRADEPPAEAPKSRAVRPPEDTDDAPAAEPEPAMAAPTPPRESMPHETLDTSPPEKPAARPVAAPEPPPKPSPVARDIRLEVGGAGPKVEVRLVERAGEVQLAVRTGDERLAGTMREHLPLLSSRLEQSGFRADQWRAAESGAPERRLDVHSAAESSGRAPDHNPGGGRERREDQPQRRQPAGEPTKPKEKGSAFEWLMQSLR
jgi:hypothetical protein